MASRWNASTGYTAQEHILTQEDGKQRWVLLPCADWTMDGTVQAQVVDVTVVSIT